MGDAIASALPVVDEVVVVDTGSTDATVAVARASGARVVEVAWPGDFAAAHALPVAHARSDWVLALDADEVLDPGSRHQIRKLVTSKQHDAYELPIRNYQYGWGAPRWRPVDPAGPLARGALGYSPSRGVRLFRRRPEYKYSGRLHATPRAAILDSGGRIGLAEVPIHHYGPLRSDRDKFDLYARLARWKVDEQPDDPWAWLQFGILLLHAGDAAPAADALHRARALGDRGAAAFHLASALLELGYAEQSIPFLREAIRDEHHAERADYDRSDAWASLGLACEDLGRVSEAEEAYRTALRLRPDSPAAAINLAGCLIDRGALDDAEGMVGRLMTRYRGSSEVWSLSGVIHLRRGELDSARAALETAVEIYRGNLVALANLGLTHLRAGRPRKAALAYRAVADQLGTEEAQQLGLEQRIPSRFRESRKPALRDGRPNLVLSVVPVLAGGPGSLLADAVLALDGRPHVVASTSAAGYDGQGVRRQLARAGADVVTVRSDAGLYRLVERLRPSVVLHHWWKFGLLDQPVRAGDERWICFSHGPLGMPFGYDAYVATSDFHRGLQSHLPAERVALIPNSVDMRRFPPRRRRGEVRPVTIALLQRLDPGKLPRRLLQYLPVLDDARVLIAGFGARRYELEPEIAECGLADRVRFVGTVSSAHVPRFLGEADIALHLTEGATEGLPKAMLEMLAAGLPVVGEPKGGVPELIAPGENGFLASDPREVAARLQELVNDASLRRRMGAAARRTARRYDTPRYRSALRKLLASVEGAPITASRPRAVSPGRWSFRPRLFLIVCATPGSGSELLCEVLTSTGIAGRPDEHFDTRVMQTLSSRWNVEGLGDAYVAELLERTSTPNGVFATKVLPHHLSCLEASGLLTTAFPNLRFVWSRRRDKVRQAVAWERARQSGRPRFDRAIIRTRLEELERAEAKWQGLFSDTRVQPLCVWHDELTSECERTTLRLLAQAGVEVPSDLRIAPCRAAREDDAGAQRWVERFTGQPASRSLSRRPTIASTARPHV